MPAISANSNYAAPIPRAAPPAPRITPSAMVNAPLPRPSAPAPRQATHMQGFLPPSRVTAPPPAQHSFLSNLGRSLQTTGRAFAKPQAAAPLAVANLLKDANFTPYFTSHPIAPSHGDSGLLASILSPGASVVTHDILPTLGHVAVNAGKDLLSMPKGLLTGSEALAGALSHDIASGLMGAATPGNLAVQRTDKMQTGELLKNMVKSDPLVSAITQGSLNPIEQHPLNALLDVTGGLGAIGKVAGMAGRAGLLGDRIAAASRLSQTAREVAPSVPGVAETVPGSHGMTVIEHAHPNLLARPIINLAKRVPLPTAAERALTDNRLTRMAAMYVGPERSRIAREGDVAMKALKDAKPAGKIEENITPYITAFGGGRDTLQALRDQIAASEQLGSPRPSTSKMAQQHLQNLDAALAKPNLDMGAVQRAADVYGARQAALEGGKAQFGLYEQPELEAALAKQYALERVPGAQYISGKGPLDPQWISAAKTAAQAVAKAQRDLRDAQAAHDAAVGAHDGAGRALTEVNKRIPLNPTTANTVYHIQDLRTALAESRAAQKAAGPQIIAQKAADLKDAQAMLKAVKDARESNRMGGLVVHDPGAPPIASGALKGQQLRRLSTDEVQQHMAANGDNPAYLRMTNPERQRPLNLTPFDAMRSNAQGLTHNYSGEAAKSGDFIPGYKLMQRSQLGDIRQVGSARMRAGFIDRFGLRAPDGGHFTAWDAEEAAKLYEHETGIKVVPVQDFRAGSADRNLVLVPKAAADEYARQMKLDQPRTGLGKAATALTRGFRNTVLPLSTKLPIMHTVENTTRAGLAGATPLDWARARSVLDMMPEDQAQRLQDLATPGGLGGHQSRLNAEDFGRDPTGLSGTRVGNAVATPFRYWEGTAQKIIGWQRWMESHAQSAALGVHMRQTLQEFGRSWAQANGKLSELDRQFLANHYANPAVAEDAARFVHKAMGQYNNFTARQRFVISRAMPFAPWYANAARLVFSTLPKDHPLVTTLINDMHLATQKQWDQQHSGLPADMQTDVPWQGGWLDVGKFTPIGLEKTPTEEIGSLLFPQYAGAALALAGKDPFGQDFKGPHGYDKSGLFSPINGLRALNQLGESTLGPAGALARAIEEHGSTAFNTSMPLFGQVQLKANSNHGPGGLLGGLERVFNPLHPTYMKAGGGSSGGAPLGAMTRLAPVSTSKNGPLGAFTKIGGK